MVNSLTGTIGTGVSEPDFPQAAISSIKKKKSLFMIEHAHLAKTYKIK